MGIKYYEANKTWAAYISGRHPITKMPKTYKRIGLKSKAEALRVERELILKLNGEFQKKLLPTWARLVEDYFKSIEDQNELMKSTVYGRRKMIAAHTMNVWQDLQIDQITTQDVHKLLTEKLGDNAEAHKKYFIKCVKGVFQFAVDSGLLARNPTPLIKFKISDKIKSVLKQDQIVHLLRKSQEQDWPWYPHYALALYSGMRNGELYALTWDKVDLEQRQLLVNCAWSSKDGFKSTKSGDDRLVEIPMALIPTLKELKLKSLGDDFVLPRMSKWDKGEQARELRFFLKAIGLPEVRFHDLRASWATLLLGKGVAPAKVMSMGGWKDMDTMMIYMRKAGISIKNSTACLDDMYTHGIQEASVIEMRPR